ncbi:putative pectin methylesterase CGR2 [Citrus sinensis]|uniref:Pectin methylesterase CGR2 n=1 Tax=Citrus sinensis TaxID=2711 RepID=A0ACB8J484_CITSI|nr:putative pectin methylesterase CGR2 [Citrus sinensis]
MSRRPVSSTRRLVDTGSFPFTGALQSKSRSSPLLSVGLVLVGAFLLIGYAFSGSGIFGGDKAAVSRSEVVGCGRDYGRECSQFPSNSLSCSSPPCLAFSLMPSVLEGTTISLIKGCDFSCTSEIQRAIPILKKAYGDSMHKVLHVGPDTCSVVSTLLKEEETEAWGVEPYDIEDADARCKSLVHKGIVRVADIKFPLPYRAKSFPLVIVSDALDYLSPKYLNKTLPDLARVASDGVIIFAGYPGQQRAKVAELSKFGRPVSGILLLCYPLFRLD